MQLPKNFDPESGRPVLIAGATASGKSSLAIEIAKARPSIIINADALQVYSGWRILTARPSDDEMRHVAHDLYGHVDMQTPYSVGHWLRDTEDALKRATADGLRPIIVGGTGLYFRALTEGLAEIPNISDEVKAQSEALAAVNGPDIFARELKESDPLTAASIDMRNPARTRRAWEVLRATGIPLARWHAETPPPLLPLQSVQPLLLQWAVEELNGRIDQRFDLMVKAGAVEEARYAAEHFWDPKLPSCQAIGAFDLISHLMGECSLSTAIDQAKLRSRQYAKRQRTWFRMRMKLWQAVTMGKG